MATGDNTALDPFPRPSQTRREGIPHIPVDRTTKSSPGRGRRRRHHRQRTRPNASRRCSGNQAVNTSYVPVQLDAGARWSTGQLIVSEVTTGKLSLPRGARGLDPLSGEPTGGIVDWQALNPRRTSHRKFLQLIKLRAATLYAIEMGRLGKALGQHDVPLPDSPVMLLHVRRASAPARRAAEALGFVVEEDVDHRQRVRSR